MASAKLFASSSSPNSDVKPRPSSSLSDQSNAVKFEDNDAALTLSLSGIFRSSQPQRKTVEEVWGEIVAVREKKECKVEPPDPNDLMTLEDFLAKADATEKECVKVERFCSDGGGILGYEYGMMVEESGGRRVKRRTMSESFDKAVQQRQRRMIKNRESAARSRERKQAYQVELEAMVVKLEEENELLLKEKEERIKQRHKELMEKIVPVVEKRKPQCALRRVSSAQW